MTKIFKIENDLLNKKNEKQDLQCVYSRAYLPTTTTLLILTNSACILFCLNLSTMITFTTAASTKASPLINYLQTITQNPIQLL